MHSDRPFNQGVRARAARRDVDPSHDADVAPVGRGTLQLSHYTRCAVPTSAAAAALLLVYGEHDVSAAAAAAAACYCHVPTSQPGPPPDAAKTRCSLHSAAHVISTVIQEWRTSATVCLLQR